MRILRFIAMLLGGFLALVWGGFLILAAIIICIFLLIGSLIQDVWDRSK